MPKEFDKIVKVIMEEIMSKYPNMDKNMIRSKAFAIGTTVYQKKYGKNP